MRGDISAAEGEAISTEFTVDTGAGGTIVTAPLVRANHLLQSVTQKIPSPSHGIGNGVSEDVVVRMGEIRLGTYVLKNPLVALSQDKEGSLADDAFVNIGGNVLSRFTVIIDYTRTDSGAGGDDLRTFTVKGVIAGSAADKAGLRQGDIITAIDGAPASKYALWELQNVLKESGKEYLLTIQRDGTIVPLMLSSTRSAPCELA
jgi:membrane-associated protease RseP (regulator of RpoE activity)